MVQFGSLKMRSVKNDNGLDSGDDHKPFVLDTFYSTDKKHHNKENTQDQTRTKKEEMWLGAVGIKDI